MINTKDTKFIRSKKIVLENKVVSGVLEIRDGIIKAILDYDFCGDNIIDYKDNIIAPGMIDSHTHGYMGYSFTGSASAKDIDKVSRLYLEQGITTILATVSQNGIKPVLSAIKNGLTDCDILGLHMEGPFINSKRFGAAPPNTQFPKPNLGHLKRLIEQSSGYLKMMTLAPELNGNELLIEELIKNDIIVAVGHSEASYKELEKISQKIDVLTHLGNAMSGISHRNMGAFGYGLNTDIYTELIADSLHIERPMLEIIFKTKSVDKIILISDSIALAGCRKGHYKMANSNLYIDEAGVILNEFDHISGSSFSLLETARNLYSNYNIDLNSLFKMASLNASKLLRVDNKLGSIQVGKIADIIVLDKQFTIIDVYKKGELKFNHNQEKSSQNPKLDDLLLDPEFLNFYGTD